MKRNVRDNIMLLLAPALGLSGTVVAGYVKTYDSFFKRYERPNYDLKPGINNIKRIDSKIKYDDVEFYSGGVKLRGRYFKSSFSKGVVICAHGIHAGGDDLLPFALYFFKHHFSVLLFNYKGTYDSEGDSTVGMCESIVDLDAAINYVKTDPLFDHQPIYLFGHSWGGYAVCSALCLHKDIKAVAEVSGLNDGYTMILEKGEEYAGKLADLPKPFLNYYQKYLFKDYVNCNATLGINSSNTKVLIAHGVEDKVISYNYQAIIAHKDEFTNPNVRYYYGLGVNGYHTDILYSKESFLYRKEVDSGLKLLGFNKKRKLMDDEIKEYVDKVDHNKYSEVNKELMDEIIKMFNER